MEIRNKYKTRVVYIGITIIVLIHAFLAAFFDNNTFTTKVETVLKIIWLISFLCSFVIFRTHIYPYICKIINNKYK